jgi:hypothetical protein
MPKFVIEREIPGAGKLSPAELQAVSQKSCGVLRDMGPEIQWLHSYVTDDKLYCVYIAPTKPPFASMPSRVDSQPIESRRFIPSSIQPRRSNRRSRKKDFTPKKERTRSSALASITSLALILRYRVIPLAGLHLVVAAFGLDLDLAIRSVQFVIGRRIADVVLAA